MPQLADLMPFLLLSEVHLLNRIQSTEPIVEPPPTSAEVSASEREIGSWKPSSVHKAEPVLWSVAFWSPMLLLMEQIDMFFACKECDFNCMDDSGFIDLKLDYSLESKLEFSAANHQCDYFLVWWLCKVERAIGLKFKGLIKLSWNWRGWIMKRLDNELVEDKMKVTKLNYRIYQKKMLYWWHGLSYMKAMLWIWYA